MPESERITVREIAEKMRMSERTVNYLLRAGAIPSTPYGRGTRRKRYFVSRVQFRRWLEGTAEERTA
jgi:excisionase family DNA binding protein